MSRASSAVVSTTISKRLSSPCTGVRMPKVGTCRSVFTWCTCATTLSSAFCGPIVILTTNVFVIVFPRKLQGLSVGGRTSILCSRFNHFGQDKQPRGRDATFSGLAHIMWSELRKSITVYCVSTLLSNAFAASDVDPMTTICRGSSSFFTLFVSSLPCRMRALGCSRSRSSSTLIVVAVFAWKRLVGSRKMGRG